jgi:membrane associated rhomboid family serine protease
MRAEAQRANLDHLCPPARLDGGKAGAQHALLAQTHTLTHHTLHTPQQQQQKKPHSPPPTEGEKKGRPGTFGRPYRRVTDALLVANVAAYVAQVASKQALTVWGAKINSAIAAGEAWRLITPALLHGNLLHLATNNYALASMGPIVERISGHARFGVVYAVSAVAGTAASYVFTKAPSVGASGEFDFLFFRFFGWKGGDCFSPSVAFLPSFRLSSHDTINTTHNHTHKGAIFGIGGALAVFFYRHRNYFGATSDAVLKALGQSLAINTAMGFAIANVDNWGHAGGLAGGALAAALLGPVLVVDRSGKGGSGEVRDEPPIPWLAAKPIPLPAK